MTDKVLINI